MGRTTTFILLFLLVLLTGFIFITPFASPRVKHVRIGNPTFQSDCRPSFTAPLGALYYCHKHPRATFKALQSYRRAYPSGTILLVNDGGDENMEHIAKYFGARYFYLDTPKFSLMGDTADEMLSNIYRYLSFIEEIPERWFVRLEDDVVLLRSICEHELLYDVNMANRGNRWQEKVYEALLKFNPNAPNYYGFGGGSVARTEVFKSLLKSPKRLNKTFEAFARTYISEKYFDDMTMSFLLFANNYTVDLPDFFSEVTWGDDWMRKLADGKLAILHQMKAFYADEFVEEKEVIQRAPPLHR